MTLLEIHETIRKSKRKHNLPAQCLDLELSHDILKELKRVFEIKDTHLGMKIVLVKGENMLTVLPKMDWKELLEGFIRSYPNSVYAEGR